MKLELEVRERVADPLSPTGPRRPERDELVLFRADLHQPGEHPSYVVSDSGPRARERTDVYDDPHAGLCRDREDEGLRARFGEPEDALADEVDGDRVPAVRLLPQDMHMERDRVAGRQ